MKQFLSLLAFLFVMWGCSTAQQNVVRISATDFGIKPGVNASPLFLQLVEKLKESPDQKVTLVFPKGRYDFYEEGSAERTYYISNHDQRNPKKVGLPLEGLKNLTLDGQGSEFIFHGRMIPVSIVKGENIELKNFSVDFEVPALRQIKITKVDQENNAVEATLYPKDHYRIDEGKLIFEGEGFEITPDNAMAFREDKRLTYNRADVLFNPKTVREIAPNILEIKDWYQVGETSVGERFVLRSYERPTPGIFIDQSLNSRLDHVTIHYAEGMGLLAQMSENIILEGFRVALRGPKDERFFTTQADATHFSACKGIIISQNGLYEGMADDAINVHGTYLKITKVVDDQTIQGRYMHPQSWGFKWGDSGDEVQFLTSGTMELLGRSPYHIESIRALDAADYFGAKEFEIKIKENLPEEMKREGKFAIENLTWTPKVYFAGNTIRNNRARGTLFSTPKEVLVERNTFDHTHGAAILLAGDANGWYETGASHHITIRNNQFLNALTANYQFTNAIISIYPEIPDLEHQKSFFHSNVIIENNYFDTFDTPILFAKSTDGILFKNNIIHKNEEFKPFHWNHYLFNFEHVQNVSIQGNKFYRDVDLSKDMAIKWSPENAVEFQP